MLKHLPTSRIECQSLKGKKACQAGTNTKRLMKGSPVLDAIPYNSPSRSFSAFSVPFCVSLLIMAPVVFVQLSFVGATGNNYVKATKQELNAEPSDYMDEGDLVYYPSDKASSSAGPKWRKLTSWSKRAKWDKLDSWGKRAKWDQLDSWGKRAKWDKLDSWGKRAKWDKLDSWGKRAKWDKLDSWGKRSKWDKLDSWGKRSPPAIYDEPDSFLKKSKWDSLNSWGKRNIGYQNPFNLDGSQKYGQRRFLLGMVKKTYGNLKVPDNEYTDLSDWQKRPDDWREFHSWGRKK